jgi:tetratricopeptide (TPR) repeat protein
MLQWFNKQTNSSSLSQEAEFEQQENRQHSLSSDSALTDEDYEFLFNQLLEGVAHGWHLGKIVKFFNNLETRSISSSEWIAWLLKFEQKIVFSNEPSQRRVGAIMMRFGELTQGDLELKELGTLTNKIGKKLFLGNTAELIWEYDGIDRVIPKESSAISAEKAIAQVAADDLNPKSAVDAVSTEDSHPQTLASLTEERMTISVTENKKINLERKAIAKKIRESASPNISEEPGISTEQPTQSPDFVVEPEPLSVESDEESLSTLDELLNEPDTTLEEVPTTEQPTQSPDFVVEPEPLSVESDEESLSTLDELLNEPDTTQEENLPTTEQPTQSPDFVVEPEPQEKEIKQNLLESLEAFTEQLTVLQDIIPESDSSAEPDLETTLVLPDTKPTSANPLSVASFLEATQALISQKKKQNTPLSWQEFITVLEQDKALAEQIARYLQVSTHHPQDIIKAAIERLTQQEREQLSPATLELVESWFHLGLKQASAEDFQGAIASWDKALKLNPNLSEAWHNRGSALGRLGRYEEAIQSFNRAINLTPRHDRAWNDRAHALYQLQKWEQAIESWNKAISITSDNYQFWYNRGCALEQLQRFEESISSYEKALEIKPDFQPARSRYISLITENSSLPPN